MSVSVLSLAIDNKKVKECLSSIIRAESAHLSEAFEVSMMETPNADVWELWLRRADGIAVSRKLRADEGDLVPAVFRIRFRELVQLL